MDDVVAQDEVVWKAFVSLFQDLFVVFVYSSKDRHFDFIAFAFERDEVCDVLEAKLIFKIQDGA